ncbi:MAG: hypothetical protein DRJ07_19000 [Bacteroidetes bacterium]|nr:MAG: hypothetical protein DRJ07_19000 [Bacteroidota bacterium]
MKTKLYRKVGSENFLNEGELCFSTDNSVSLSPHGEFCLVLEEKEYKGRYTEGDTDAKKNFGYDELRVEMTRDELISNINCIVVPNEWADAPDIEYAEGEDPFDWIENLESYGTVIAERDYNEKIDFNF